MRFSLPDPSGKTWNYNVKFQDRNMFKNVFRQRPAIMIKPSFKIIMNATLRNVHIDITIAAVTQRPFQGKPDIIGQPVFKA